MNIKEFNNTQNEMKDLFFNLFSIQNEIHDKLIKYSNGKTLKGNELVGWLGEIYIKILFNGKLVDDRKEHDVEDREYRYSVKTRRGRKSGWNRTSAIPKLEGEDSPTHLIFINLNEDYSVNTIWKFPWNDLLEKGLFKDHIVRENFRSYYFSINQKRDKDYIIYTSVE